MSNLSNQGIPFYIRELVNSSFYEFVTPRYNAVRAREKRGVYIEIVDDVGWVVAYVTSSLSQRGHGSIIIFLLIFPSYAIKPEVLFRL